MCDDVKIVVIDNGSFAIKAGFAGDDTPKSVFQSVVGRPKYKRAFTPGGQDRDLYIGDDAWGCSGLLHPKHPIERGNINSSADLDDMKKIWDYTFYDQLRVDPAEHPVLMNDNLRMSKHTREVIIQTMFEKYSVPSFYMSQSTTLALYASGRSTGTVVDIGDSLTEIGCHYEHTLLWPATYMPLGGRDIANYMMKIFRHLGGRFDRWSDQEMVREAKEEWGYIALDFDEEMKKDWDRDFTINYPLPTGNIVTVTDERVRCPELLFQPKLNHFWFNGIAKTLVDSLSGRDVDIREDLYANIVLSGGTSMFPGLPERLEKEVARLAPSWATVKVVAPPERKYAVWIGGSILACLPTFPKMVITHEEYNEAGPGIVHRRCF